MANPYLERLVDRAVAGILTDLPAVMIVGPRASGKTTTAARLCNGRLRLDRVEDLTQAKLDPERAIDRAEPVLIDEWQLAPGVLSAVKRAVDDDFRPGRFVLTGSTQNDITTSGWPATGRVVRVEMWGMTVRELRGTTGRAGLLDAIVDGGIDAVLDGPTGEPADAVIDLAFQGSLPQVALAGNDRSRRMLLAAYIDQLISRDVGSEHAVDPVRLRRYLRSIAANTAGIPTHKLLYDAAEIDRATALRYDSLLELVMVTERLPAWSNNRMAQLVQLPKRHLIDVSLLQPLLGIDARKVRRDSDLLGRMLDSFVLAQLRPERAVAEHAHRFFHVRTANGRQEVDLLAEFDDGRVLAIEVKAERAPGAVAARHLAALRDLDPDRFAGGIVFHTGPNRYRIGDRLVALPISAIWEP